MRRSLAVILSTATLGTMIAATGCAEHRYPTSGPYYGAYNGYNGWDAAEQARYREWLAERRYGYIEYNRLNAERQREYWAWRNSRYPRVQDQYRDYNRERVNRERNDRDRDDRNRQYVRDRDDRGYRGDRDDQDRRYSRDRNDRNRAYQNHSRDRDHDRRSNNRNHDRDHDHDHDHDHR